jgi:hypothetical protein
VKYLPSVALFYGAFMADVSVPVAILTAFLGFLLALGALGKADVPLVKIDSIRWPNVK